MDDDDVGALYREHAGHIWRYVRARVATDADAEDVVSDVFMRAMRSKGNYDSDRGTEVAWLVGIARHATADHFRRRRPETAHEDVPETVGPDEPGERALEREETSALHRNLSRLSEREREALALRFGAELSSPEIGAQLDISPTAARMLVHRAVTKLRGWAEHA